MTLGQTNPKKTATNTDRLGLGPLQLLQKICRFRLNKSEAAELILNLVPEDRSRDTCGDLGQLGVRSSLKSP